LTDNQSTSKPAGQSAAASFSIRLVKIVTTVSTLCVFVQVAGRECITAHLSTPPHSRLSGPHCAAPPACIPRLVHLRKRLRCFRITSCLLPAWFCLPVPWPSHAMPCLTLQTQVRLHHIIIVAFQANCILVNSLHATKLSI